MKAGSLIFLFVSNRIKLPLSPTTISTTHANEVRRRNKPNLPVRNLDLCSPPQQQVGLTGGKVAQVSLFLIRSVSRECVQQNQQPLSILFSTSLFFCVQLKDDRDCEQFSPNYRAAGPARTWKRIRENSFVLHASFQQPKQNCNTHLFGNTQVWALLCNYIKVS